MKYLIMAIAIVIISLYEVDFVHAASIINTTKSYTYEEYQEDVWILKSKYKNQLRIISFGNSEFGRKLYAIQVGKGKNNIMITGAHHGREWITSLLTMKMVEETAISLQANENYLDQFSIWFVPMLNPDGVTIQQGDIEKFPFLSKRRILKMNNGSTDFSSWKSNGLGIDLNRQYPAGWEALQHGSEKPSYKNYKGQKPLEARETNAIVKLTEQIKPVLAVSYHSSGQEIFWQYKNDNEQRDKKIAEAISKETGYKLGEPKEDAVGGGYTDWFITTYQLPAFTIEICPLVEETNPPISSFASEWRRNKEIPLLLIDEAKTYIKSP